MAEKLEFDLKVGVNELQKAISDATTGSKKLGDTISTALGTFAGQAAIKGFGLLGDAIGSVGSFLKESVKASQEQEDALNKLSQALRATGSFTQQALDDFDQFSDQLERVSLFAGDVVLSQIAVAKSFGATNQQAKDLVQAAANLAATFGGTLEENVAKLSKTLSGVVSKDLKAAIPELRSFSKEAIESGEAIRLVNERFGGAAAAQVDTYTGQLNQLEDAFGKIQEEVGNVITQSDIVKGAFEVVSSTIFSLVDALKAYQTQSKVQKQGFVDTQTEIDILSVKYAQLTDKILEAQNIVANPTLFDKLLARPLAASENIKILSKELEVLSNQIDKSQAKLAETQQPEQKKRETIQTDQELTKLRELESQKTQIVGQAELERETFKAQLANESIQNEFAKQEAEIQRIAEFEAQKAELAFQFAEQKAAAIQDESLRAAELARIGKERELEFTKIANKQLLSEEQLRNKKAQDSIFAFKKFEDKTNKERVQDLQSTFSTIATLSDSGNRTLATIGKAAAISTATIDGFVAVNKALASAPPPINYGLAAAVGAATAANVAKIAGVKFEQGGFVGGVNGASIGPDNTVAQIREGELVLNAEDQRSLLNMIKSGGMGGDIVVQVDGREIARAVRTQLNAGFRLA